MHENARACNDGPPAACGLLEGHAGELRQDPGRHVRAGGARAARAADHLVQRGHTRDCGHALQMGGQRCRHLGALRQRQARDEELPQARGEKAAVTLEDLPQRITPQGLRALISSGGELAILDVREEGVHARNHLFLASSAPLSLLELRIGRLVPRLTARIVLVDDDEALAQRAARVLRRLGYRDLHVLAGGNAAWQAAGYELYSGVHVPSKAFGEHVEHHDNTPRIAAAELKAKIEAGEDLVVLDSRPMNEYRVMNIPGALDCPGAELVYRVHEAAPSPQTLVVVNCAGRTRSIIGAQSLINAGVPNKVVALKNGTMGWHLAGLELESGQSRTAAAPSGSALANAKAAAA